MNCFRSSLLDSSLEWCVYVVTYSGDKLPPFYVGYTRTKRLLKENYHGSIRSKKWKDIWRTELELFPTLFRRKIIRTFSTREEASGFEREFLSHFDAKNNSLFYNLSNGLGDKGCAKGFKHSEEQKRKWSIERKFHIVTKETRQKISKSKMGHPVSSETREKLRKAHLGSKKPKSLETREKLSKSNKGQTRSKEARLNMKVPKSEKHKEVIRKIHAQKRLEWEAFKRKDPISYSRVLKELGTRNKRVPKEYLEPSLSFLNPSC